MKADRVYRNREDTRRVRVYRHESGEGWDFDIFTKHEFGGGWRVEAAFCTSNGESLERTLKGALAWCEDRVGELTELRSVQTVTEGWPEKEPPKPTKDAAVEIRAGQVWRQGSRRLRVTWIKPHWNRQICSGENEVGYLWIEESNRARGHAIVGRRAKQSAREQHFREKFRFVSDPNTEEKS